MIWQILGFVMSIWGVMCLLLGFVTFLLLPVISKASRFKVFSSLFLGLATFPIKRAAFVISESNEAYFKQLSLDLGFLHTKLDGEDKLVEDPAQRLHHWLGIRFGIVWEENGVVYDPRDAAAGMRKRLLDDRDEGEYLATEEEWDKWGVSKWKPAVFEMPRDYEIVDLSAFKEFIDGGERAEYAERVEEYYLNAQSFLGDSTPMAKYLYPIIGFSVPFFGIWLMKSQIAGPDSVVSYGGFLWLLIGLLGGSGGDKDADRSDEGRDWKYIGGIVLLVGTPLVVVGLLYYFLGPVLTIAIVGMFLFGMLLMPIFTVLGQASSMIAGALSKLYFKLGFLGYRRPVFVWTPAKYVVREYDSLNTTEQQQATWYDLFGQVVGFSYEPTPESWGAEYMTHSEIEAETEPKRKNNFKTDGGEWKDNIETNLPPKYVRSEQIQHDDMGGFLPKRVSDAMYYIRTDILMNRFKNTAVGDKALRRLLEAKEKHGGESDGLDPNLVFKTTMVSGILGAASGIGIFLLPAIL